MKIKSITPVILSAVLCLSYMTACGNSENTDKGAEKSGAVSDSQSMQSSRELKNSEAEESIEVKQTAADTKVYDKIHKLYIKDSGKNTAIKATFLNSLSGDSVDIEMEKSGEDTEGVIFTCEADVTKYNTVHVTYGDKTSKDVSFNSFVSGWYILDNNLYPYTEGKTTDYTPEFETKKFSYQGDDKNIFIWTPEGYDPDNKDKYSTIYMLDGQNVFGIIPDIGDGEGIRYNPEKSWNAIQSVSAMMSVTENKAVIVGIESGQLTRNDELIPDIGELSLTGIKTKKQGNEFSDFVCDTVMPYIQENYNVYNDASHNAIAGSSYGGLETFYICMEHPEKFGAGGILSPSFQMYNEPEWDSYIAAKSFDEKSPYLYFYSGGFSSDTGKYTEMIYNKMIEVYPKESLIFDKNEKGEHNETFWRNIYPEFLEAMFTRKLSAIENGTAVKYEDRFDPDAKTLEFSFAPDDDRPDEIRNYIFFDNSETKWEKVYAYWWGGKPFNIVTRDVYFNEWPGFEMEKIEGTDIWRIEAPLGVTGIIFNTGVTDQEVRDGKEAYQTSDLKYSTDNTGMMYKIDVSKKPEPGTGKDDATKFKYSEGEWTEYKP